MTYALKPNLLMETAVEIALCLGPFTASSLDRMAAAGIDSQVRNEVVRLAAKALERQHSTLGGDPQWEGPYDWMLACSEMASRIRKSFLSLETPQSSHLIAFAYTSLAESAHIGTRK